MGQTVGSHRPSLEHAPIRGPSRTRAVIPPWWTGGVAQPFDLEDIDRRLAALAAHQHGLVQRRQVLAIGCSARMLEYRVARGQLERLAPRVYRLAGVPETWHQRVLTGCWAAGGVAAARTAAALYDLDGFPRRVIEVVTDRGKGRAHALVRVAESTDLVSRDRTERHGIPLTSIERTIIDLAAVVGPAKVEQALDDALRQRLTTSERVNRRLVELARRGRSGVAVARPLVEARLGGTGRQPGEFERRLARVLVAAGLPAPTCEYEVRTQSGILVARVDLAYVPRRVALECDSERWHSGRQRRQRDLQRQNALILAGWTVLRFTWNDLVDRPGSIVAQVRAALAGAA